MSRIVTPPPATAGGAEVGWPKKRQQQRNWESQSLNQNPSFRQQRSVGAVHAAQTYTEGTLEQFELNNKPGALAQLAGKLAKKAINIDSASATMPEGAKKAVNSARSLHG